MAKNYNPSIVNEIFQDPEHLHMVLLRVPLKNEEMVEKYKNILKNMEDEIHDLIKFRGLKDKLSLSFDNLGVFGSPKTTRELYMRLKPRDPNFLLLQDLMGLIVQHSLKHDIINHKELQPPILFNHRMGKFYHTQMHLTLASSAWGRHNTDKTIG